MKKILIREEYCMGCKVCEVHCLTQHSKTKNIIKAYKGEFPKPLPRIIVEEKGYISFALQCRHCENAQCVSICPTGAMKRLGQEGPVIIDHDLCVGCRSCVVVCHFGVPKMSEDGKALIKCDMCIERLEQDEEPACVDACPTDALYFVPFGKPAGPEQFIDRFAPRAEK